MATHSGILAWRIPWTEEPVGLQSMGSQESETTEQLTLSLYFSLSDKMRSRGCALIQHYFVLIKTGNWTERHVHQEMTCEPENSCLQAKERGREQILPSQCQKEPSRPMV